MKNVLKWAGLILLGIAIILVIAGFLLSSKGNSAISQKYEVTANLLSEVPSDSAALADGHHLALTLGCFDCHGETLGGRVFVDAPPFLVAASNLTAGMGGIGSTYSIEDWDRTLRYGVKPSGEAVVIMPSKTYHNLSDEDAARLIAYVRSVPAVDNTLPKREIRILGTLLVGAGELDLSESVHTSANRQPKPPVGPTSEYGAYIASLTCIYCHGSDLRGGPPLDPNSPVPPDLAAAGAWPFEAFETALRTGVTPTGHQMDPEMMPWTFTKYMTDDELHALYARLQDIVN